MGQFALIFTHSLLAYIKGPQCGSPDFSKLLLVRVAQTRADDPLRRQQGV
jgi:hypothetical protein